MQILGEDEIKAEISSLNGAWTLVDNSKIEGIFEFKNFKEALKFVNGVGEIAEEIQHHPNIQILYGKVILDIFTHDKKSITSLDFKLAERVDALGPINDEEILKNINVLKNGSDFERRKPASRLGKIGNKKAVGPLIKTLKDSDRFVRKASARSLGKIGDKRAIKPLIQILGSEDPEFRWHAKEALVKVGASSEDLTLAFKSNNHHKRELALEALNEIGGKKSEIIIKKALSDESIGVRWRAARAVLNCYDDNSVKILKNLSEEDPNFKVREESTETLKAIEKKVKDLFNRFEEDLKFTSEDIKAKNIKEGKSFFSPEKKLFEAHFFNPYKIRFYVYQGKEKIPELDKMKDPEWGAIYLQREEDLGKVLEAVKKSYIMVKK